LAKLRRTIQKYSTSARKWRVVAAFVILPVVFLLLLRARDWTAVAAISAFAAALAVVYQTCIYRFSLGVDLTLKLDERFEGIEFQKKRAKAARALRQDSGVPKPDVEDVLDFFETLGFLVRRKALDKELVWNTFFYVFYGYCLYAKIYVEAQAQKYPPRYKDLRWLKPRLVDVEECNNGTLDEAEWSEFLDEEEEKGRQESG
jgi:hypothetical protein